VTVSLIRPTQKLAFSGAYLDGILGAALLDKFAVPADADWDAAPSVVKLRRSHMKKRSMLLALLADQIVLHNPPNIIDISRIRAVLDAEVIDPLACGDLRAPDTDQDGRLIEAEYALDSLRLAIELKPFLSRAVRQRLRGLTKGSASMWRNAGDLYDLAVFMGASLGEEAMSRCKPEFKSMLAEVMEVPCQDAEILRALFDGLVDDSRNLLVSAIVVLIFDLQNWTSLVHQGDIRSFAIASDAIDLYVRGNIASLESAYSLCVANLASFIDCVPRIDSFEDLLRLREKKEIKRLRCLVQEWAESLQEGDATVENRIQSEIKRAIAATDRVARLQKLDRFFYLISIPTATIPVMSSVITYASTSCRYLIERNQRRHGWIAIGA